jgi:hypothetical protein
MTTSKIVFPVSDAARKLIMDVCKHLLGESAKRYPYNGKVKDAISELLNFLPEVQFHGSRLQEVSIEGEHYEFIREKPQRPLMQVIGEAEEFDSYECEVMLLRYRYQQRMESDAGSVCHEEAAS